MSDENGFVPFICSACGQEIEASRDMAGTSVECPACGARLTVPAPGQTSATASSPAQLEAMKSRTIRIELPGL